MKKLIYVLLVLNTAVIFSGCDVLIVPRNHYVSVYNSENYKYITSLYSKDNGYYGEYWSRNMINDFIYPYESYDLLMDEGVYDFKVIMEDEDYSYEIDIYEVYIYENVNLDICYDCYDKNAKIKITKTPKKTTNTTNK